MHGAVPQRGVMLRECKGLVQGLVAQDFDGECPASAPPQCGSPSTPKSRKQRCVETGIRAGLRVLLALAIFLPGLPFIERGRAFIAKAGAERGEGIAHASSGAALHGFPWSRHFRQSTMLHFLPSLRHSRTQPSSGAAPPGFATDVRADPIELVRPNAPRNCRPSNRASPRACLEFFRTGAWAALEYTELRGARSPAVQNKPAPGYRSAGLNGQRASRSKMVVFNVSTPTIHSRLRPFICFSKPE